MWYQIKNVTLFLTQCIYLTQEIVSLKINKLQAYALRIASLKKKVGHPS